jgi:hypothetical protein
MRGASNVSHGLSIGLLHAMRFILRLILLLRQFLWRKKTLVVKRGLPAVYCKLSFFLILHNSARLGQHQVYKNILDRKFI